MKKRHDPRKSWDAKPVLASLNHFADDEETTLKAAGMFDNDAIFQPITAEQLQQELLNAQDAYVQGDYTDALAFYDKMQ